MVFFSSNWHQKSQQNGRSFEYIEILKSTLKFRLQTQFTQLTLYKIDYSFQSRFPEFWNTCSCCHLFNCHHLKVHFLIFSKESDYFSSNAIKNRISSTINWLMSKYLSLLYSIIQKTNILLFL